jgi:hypothetical protein
MDTNWSGSNCFSVEHDANCNIVFMRLGFPGTWKYFGGTGAVIAGYTSAVYLAIRIA